MQTCSQGLLSYRPLGRARRDPGWVWSRATLTIDQFRYIIQPKTIDLRTRLRGTTTEFVGFQEKEKTNSSYKHNNKVSHGIFNLTFRMLQHTSSEVTVTKYEEI